MADVDIPTRRGGTSGGRRAGRGEPLTGIGQRVYDTLVPSGSPGRGIDTAILRQFDDREGGGIFDLDTYNPTTNTQVNQPARIPGTDVETTEGAGSVGVGYQPGQGLTQGTRGITGRTLDEARQDLENAAEDAGLGNKIGALAWAAVLIGTFLIVVNALAKGIGEGIVS